MTNLKNTSIDMENNNPNEMLSSAISKYDFELMKVALKSGANVDNMILHRIINHDRLDLVEYFLFSSELQKHCEIDYKYDYFGDGAAFVYACGQGSINIVDFLLNDERVSSKFNFRKITDRAITEIFNGGYFNVLEMLMKHQKTQDFCNKDKLNVKKLINIAESRKREEFIKDLIFNLEDMSLVESVIEATEFYKQQAKGFLKQRVFKEELENSLKNKAENKPIRNKI
jgi:hypothetical protein